MLELTTQKLYYFVIMQNFTDNKDLNAASCRICGHFLPHFGEKLTELITSIFILMKKV